MNCPPDAWCCASCHEDEDACGPAWLLDVALPDGTTTRVCCVVGNYLDSWAACEKES